MKNLLFIFLIFSFATFLQECKSPYFPPIPPKQTNYLVVEGYITSDSPTVIKLSRTHVVSQYDTAHIIPEINATVVVGDDQGNSYPLREDTAGVYVMDPVFLPASFKYRLHIFTSNHKEYQSAFVPFETSPPITGTDWSLKYDGVQMYVSTKDESNESHYYRWVYRETWEYHTPYTSGFEYDPVSNQVFPRIHPAHICWVTGNSSTIVLGSSAARKDNILHNNLVFFPEHDERLSVLYSTLITQYQLDSAAYNFWKTMQNNTENIGTLFDAQPHELTGNIRCLTDTAEKVIGYIGAGNTSEYRGFIDNRSLPPTWNRPTDCTIMWIPDVPDTVAFYLSVGYIPLYEVYMNNLKGYDVTYKECGDCTFKGTTVKPAFWP
ncbi:MAG: DUF4249 domain-containing protein [Ginsengibacter sp.]